MKDYKVCTGTKNTGKFGRFLIMIILFIGGSTSCSLLDQPNTEDVISSITGNWNCQEISANFGTQNYEVTVSKSSEMSIHILNFFIDGMEIYAEVEGFSITIPKQTINGYEISGSGTIASNYKKIEWSYTIIDAGGTSTFTASYTPQ